MKTSDFFYDLPPEQIAQTPIEPRDHSRLLVWDRASEKVEHRRFFDLPAYLQPGDALILNKTRVLPARIFGARKGTGGHGEFLLLRNLGNGQWETLAKPGRRARQGTEYDMGQGCIARIDQELPDGGRVVSFQVAEPFEQWLSRVGTMPLPPYIKERLTDEERYQTVYGQITGSAAAPTAGLHFTPELLKRIEQKGVQIIEVLLHVGLGTFRPVSVEDTEQHHMHSEFFQVTEESAKRINAVRQKGGRIICVGTTTVRTLESTTNEQGVVLPGSGETDIFIQPGYTFRAVDGLVTNFHLPESTLLMLVSALMGQKEALAVYGQAVEAQYRFFSFGDAMLIV